VECGKQEGSETRKTRVIWEIGRIDLRYLSYLLFEGGATGVNGGNGGAGFARQVHPEASVWIRVHPWLSPV